ncbi:hypothetical protein DPMN_051712 [Dreissena polymorpha]|uniref:Uncharacterized protein n=1 Tax=Dreissena polymorpha TaxID=45954 RepID=A0A9D4HP78_DREPO|nr:hypothetical protein DPMN_051712 [Dreissena polymorpha]
MNGAYKLLNTTNTTYASLANVTCDVGYESNANATWATAKCFPNDCGSTPVILNGAYKLLNTTNSTFASLANVTCDDGYESNVSQIMCQANATWATAKCIPIDCGSTPVILNGAYNLLNTTNTTYASLANVTCDVGYESNVSQIMCQANATWATAKCIPNDCGSTPVILNGAYKLLNTTNTTLGVFSIVDCGSTPVILNGAYKLLNTTNTTYASLANVTCDDGYESNVSQIMCQANATWAKAKCIPNDCGSKPVILNGAYYLLNTTNTTYASLANVTCDVGYESNVSQIMCQANATWATAKCIPNDCGAVPAVLNGRYTLLNTTNTTYGSLANVTCGAGYESNVSQVMCQANATWGHANCIPKDCGFTPVILNGAYTLLNTTNTTYAALANVTCDVGYESNVSQIMCQANATWPTAKCIPNDCGSTPVILNGAYTLLNTTNTTYASLANVTCDVGYESNVSQIMCQANATWTTAKCIPNDCGSTPVILNGAYTLLNTTNTTYVALANVTCDVGYESNVSQIMCQANATWATVKCIPNDCGSTPVILNGAYKLLNTTNTTYASLANVTCDVGYESNVSQIMCQANATWEHANCIPKDCGSTPVILNGAYKLLNTTNTTYASLANVTCDVGYESNVSQIMCQANATWSTAKCIPNDCGAIPAVLNGIYTLLNTTNTTYVTQVIQNGAYTLLNTSNTKYGSLANLTCDAGYESNVSQIMCRENATWGHADCIQKDCGSTPVIQNGAYTLLNASNTKYGSLANVTCDAGYEWNVSQIMCQANATWGHAHCVPKDCGRLDNPQHGDIRNPMNTSTYGTIVTFTCTNGYTLTGSSVRRCDVTGQSVAWNGTITTCVIKECGPLSKPDNGDVVLNAGTKFEAVANYSCNEGFKLVGDTSRICQNTGTWSGVQPTCAKNGSQIVVCTANTDSRGMDWGEVLAGEMRTQSCEAGFTGNVTRKCLEDGKWQLPNYNCIRPAVNNVLIVVDSLQANSTTSDVVDALTQIANVTNQDQQTNASSLLTNAEIISISSSLETVANLVEEKGLVTPDVAKNFFKSASNLLDDKNKGSWQSMQESKSNGGERVLSSVDKLGEALRNKIQNGTDGFNTSTTIIETNVAIEVKKVKKQDVKFPTTSITIESSKDDWVKDSQSSIRLDAEALGNTDVVVTAIMYKDMSDILPTSSEDITVYNVYFIVI